jgi:hypothetical protein
MFLVFTDEINKIIKHDKWVQLTPVYKNCYDIEENTY